MKVITEKNSVVGLIHYCPKCKGEVFNDLCYMKNKKCDHCGEKIEFPEGDELIQLLKEAFAKADIYNIILIKLMKGD